LIPQAEGMKVPSVFFTKYIMFKYPLKKYEDIKIRALIHWNSLRVNQHYWTPEISVSKPYKKGYQLKLQLSRIPYDKTHIQTDYASKEYLNISGGLNLSPGAIQGRFKKLNKPIPKITADHILGSSNVGECTLDNPHLIEDNGFGEFFQLFLHSLLVTRVTRKENDDLALLRGKFLTKDKYNELGIKLYDKDNNEVELPCTTKNTNRVGDKKIRFERYRIQTCLY
jgi:hypothetical protein